VHRIARNEHVKGQAVVLMVLLWLRNQNNIYGNHFSSKNLWWAVQYETIFKKKQTFLHPKIFFREVEIKHSIVSYVFLYNLEYKMRSMFVWVISELYDRFQKMWLLKICLQEVSIINLKAVQILSIQHWCDYTC
jgi:hypothetical protein